MKTITRVLPITKANVTMADLTENAMYDRDTEIVGKYSNEKELLAELRSLLDGDLIRVVKVGYYSVRYVRATMTLSSFYQFSNHVEATETPAKE